MLYSGASRLDVNILLIARRRLPRELIKQCHSGGNRPPFLMSLTESSPVHRCRLYGEPSIGQQSSPSVSRLGQLIAY